MFYFRTRFGIWINFFSGSQIFGRCGTSRTWFKGYGAEIAAKLLKLAAPADFLPDFYCLTILQPMNIFILLQIFFNRGDTTFRNKKVLAGKLNLKLMIISEHWGQKLAEKGSKESWTDMLRYVADERRLF